MNPAYNSPDPSTPSNSQDEKIKDDFKLERYKYINQQLNALNETVHKFLTFFQALSVAIVGGAITIFISWRGLKVDAATARLGIQGLMKLLIFLALFVVASIIAGIFSWFDYRKEESKLLNDVVAPGFRPEPKIINFWRWHETYIVLFIIIAAIYIYALIGEIIPLVQ